MSYSMREAIACFFFFIVLFFGKLALPKPAPQKIKKMLLTWEIAHKGKVSNSG